MTPPHLRLIRPPSPLLIRISLALASILVCAYAQWWVPTGTSFFADEWLRDHFIQWQASSAPEPRVLVVDIDEASTAELGAWPWPRARLADLVETLLTEYGARGVALDIVMPEPADAEGDMRLNLLSRHGPVVLAQAFDYSRMREQPLRSGHLAGASVAHGARAIAASGFIANHAALGAGAKIGNIGFLPDADGTLRRLPMLTGYAGQVYPALSLALVDCCNGAAALPLRDGMMRVAYRRDWNAYTVVSAADILARRIVPSSAAGRLAIIGSSSLGLGDRVTTPMAANRPGLGVQAAMLSTLLDLQSGLGARRWPGRWLGFLFALAAVAGASYAFPRLSAVAGTALLGALATLWLAAAYLISLHDDAFSTTGPLASQLIMLAFAVPYQWQLAQRKSRHLLGTLRQYVAPAVVAELLRSDLQDPLAPRQLDVTTLIADMEGYTSHVEALPVEEAARLTRDFLDCLTGPVIEKQGTLDKYTGDGLVAFWGAPLPNLEHADLALEAARDIVRRVRALSDARLAAGMPALRVRIGIESGLAMAGDFGTSFRSIYTAVGDSVNTASRLEQAARDFSHDVIIGAGTVVRARRHQFIPLGERLLRGKEKPTNIFTFDPCMDSVSLDNSTSASIVPTGLPA